MRRGGTRASATEGGPAQNGSGGGAPRRSRPKGLRGKKPPSTQALAAHAFTPHARAPAGPRVRAPQYFAFYDAGDNAGCYHRVTDGWPISRLDTAAIGGSWDAPTRPLVLFQVRPPRIRPRPWRCAGVVCRGLRPSDESTAAHSAACVGCMARWATGKCSGVSPLTIMVAQRWVLRHVPSTKIADQGGPLRRLRQGGVRGGRQDGRIQHRDVRGCPSSGAAVAKCMALLRLFSRCLGICAAFPLRATMAVSGTTPRPSSLSNFTVSRPSAQCKADPSCVGLTYEAATKWRTFAGQKWEGATSKYRVAGEAIDPWVPLP
jgi:hypothetical protein